MNCPRCGGALQGLGTYCWMCLDYVDDLQVPVPGVLDAEPADDPRSEKEIQQAVKNSLRAMGLAIWDTSQPFKAAITPGLPDLFVTGRGLCGWIEVKSAKGQQTDAQENFQRAVEANGGRYAIVRHEAEAIDVVNRWAAA